MLIAFVNMGLVDYIHPVVADRRLNFGQIRQPCRKSGGFGNVNKCAKCCFSPP